jgi:molybdenum cofactor cytidylyltransferase
MANSAVLVLAAGEASRMGKPKQLLPYNDSTILKTVLDKTNKAKVGNVYCVLGANYNQIQASIKDLSGIQIFNNKCWEQGIGSSISYGLKQILRQEPDLDNILIALADQPLIQVAHYQKLLASIGNSQVVATEYESGQLGVPAIFNKSCFEQLLGLQGNIGAKKLINSIPNTLAIPIKVQLLKDIDTPEDYENLLKLH